jgi:hypothetical protein
MSTMDESGVNYIRLQLFLCVVHYALKTELLSTITYVITHT